jgi:hypothetical protein
VWGGGEGRKGTGWDRGVSGEDEKSVLVQPNACLIGNPCNAEASLTACSLTSRPCVA